ncbi:MAG: hypothetical protein ACRCTW_05745 [Lactococcus garvieae]
MHVPRACAVIGSMCRCSPLTASQPRAIEREPTFTAKNGSLRRSGSSAAKKNDFETKRKSKSSIWDYFGYKKEDVDQKEVLCMECHKVVATKQRNTTNLSDHLKRQLFTMNMKPNLDVNQNKQIIVMPLPV